MTEDMYDMIKDGFATAGVDVAALDLRIASA